MTVRFHNAVVSVKESDPPEEFLCANVGKCGRWQISIALVAFLSECIHGLNIFSSAFLAPKLNYTCENGNGSQCFDVNGSECKNFIFFKEYKLVTLTEKFLLVCEKEEQSIWIRNFDRLGMMGSYLLTGWFADTFGRRLAAMIFIPLQSLAGVLVITSSNYECLLFFKLLLGLCSAAINLLPKVTLCDAVGNNWRTFALGFTMLPLPINMMVLPYFVKNFSHADEIIATTSLLPLILLLPLLYFRNSPTYILLTYDVDRAEKALRKIAKFNNHPLADNFRIRPVAVIDVDMPDSNERWALWQSSETRYPFLALLCLWFFEGFCFKFLLSYIYKDFESTPIFGASALLGCSISIIICHFMVHKIVIAVFAFLKNFFTLGVFLIDVYLKETITQRAFIMKMFAICLVGISYAALDNLTPRMFPTQLRSQSLGLCFTLFYAGSFLSFITFYYSNKLIWAIIGILVIAPIFELFSCFWLWNVHKRELPDYVVDAINFKKFFKPIRFLNIEESFTPTEELEIKVLDLETRG